jgi:hypothetical protein
MHVWLFIIINKGPVFSQKKNGVGIIFYKVYIYLIQIS